MEKSSRPQPSPRRTSKSIAYESLPTPPPDPREHSSENIFKYPPCKKDLPSGFQNLLDANQRHDEFYKTLNKVIAESCRHTLEQRDSADGSSISPSALEKSVKCEDCQQLQMEVEEFMKPLQHRLDSSITAAMAAYGAMEQLSRLYRMWDEYCQMERKFLQGRERLKYANLLNEKMEKFSATHDSNVEGKAHASDTEMEIENSIALLDSILSTDNGTTAKRNTFKQQRERSKSMMIDSSTSLSKIGSGDGKNMFTGPHLLRRQSTYSDGKSKVSKWTKVKAAFKWERANVPTLNDNAKEGIGLTPVNNEVARYLRVPSHQGGSSADSILSSSSGHLLSETGTPGTVSSASSMEDLESSCRNTIRRDSSKSDTKIDGANTDDADLGSEGVLSEINSGTDLSRCNKTEAAKTAVSPHKSSSNKSLRKYMIVPDFEALPENDVAEIKATPMRKVKLPPSPLNLDLKQDLNDLDNFCSPSFLKSPRDGTQSLNRSKKVNSPGNSSVPSSPSRHSDFFAEFESEDFSSGDFSEPTTPNHMNSRKTYQQKKEEINQRYQMLRAKLSNEFDAKRLEWEKMKSNPNTCRALALISPTKSAEISPKQTISANMSAKLLEENLTPDFKKKLRKWRVKKQISVGSNACLPVSPNKESVADTKAKIDWNLWKTGQLKLEGQGLSPLPDQKTLPEDFQKKLEQWNKIKRGGSITGGTESLKRLSKHGDSSKKGSEDERSTTEKEKRSDKHKTHEKEKLAKLKAIVSEHPTKEIEVKTSVGVMKFEGISRKFTRKLYEWEKARGIGPESSTFALLHPGYCPLDVGRISKDNHNNENSPTLSRSLSLDSVAPNMTLAPIISQQASSLSLNDVNDLKELDVISKTETGTSAEFKKFEEPEAVMVEVEDHIVETASPLVTVHNFVQHQTPIYRYEEVACNDYCNTKSVQSYESHTNLAPLLSVVKRTDDIIAGLKMLSPEIKDNECLQQCEITLGVIRSIYPFYVENLMKPNVLNAISDVQTELSRINELCEKCPLDEACCKEVLEERSTQYDDELRGLHDSLELLKEGIHGGVYRLPKDIVPDINITTEDANDSSPMYTVKDFLVSKDQLSTTLEAADELSGSHLENELDTSFNTSRSFNGNNSNLTSNGNTKKKLRLRKMGSRQNSKTESDSSDEDGQNTLETPRRLKRKNFRLKQRSLDDEYRKNEEVCITPIGTTAYQLKIKPGQLIEQRESAIYAGGERSNGKSTKSSGETYSQALLPLTETVDGKEAVIIPNPNVFVRTKRKVFTTITEPSGIAVIQHDVGVSNPPIASEREEEKNVEKNQQQIMSTSRNRERQRTYRSLSLTDINTSDLFDSRKCSSAESIKLKKQESKEVRPPLASDSFRVINKSLTMLARDASNAHKSQGSEAEEITQPNKQKPHLYRKNNEKSASGHSKFNSGTVKRIENRVTKTQSSSAVEHGNSSFPDRMDNTLPKIFRKLDSKSLTPTLRSTKFEYPPATGNCSFSGTFPPASEPTTPSIFEHQQNRPGTPLSERALRLQKAKTEFLQGTMPRPRPSSIRRREEIVRNEQYRRSDQSLSSATTGDDCSLLKSASVDTITASIATPSEEAGTDADVGIYDSLPRAVSRSGKISSKLGFATLASKFRRGKGRKGSKDSSTSNSALSALCRQSLFADAIVVPQIMGAEAEPFMNESVMKSQSSPQASSGGQRRMQEKEIERLNKSQSEQYVRRQKESYV